jgi:hypothetical protein
LRWDLANSVSNLASNLDPPDLCLQRNWDCRVHLALTISGFRYSLQNIQSAEQQLQVGEEGGLLFQIALETQLVCRKNRPSFNNFEYRSPGNWFFQFSSSKCLYFASFWKNVSLHIEFYIDRLISSYHFKSVFPCSSGCPGLLLLFSSLFLCI